MTLIYVMAGVLAFIGVLMSAFKGEKRSRRRYRVEPRKYEDFAEDDYSVDDFCPYGAKDYFFSVAENKFFQVLRGVVGESLLIFSKVRLCDLLDVHIDRGRQSALNKINRKHVDFVLCTNDGKFRPLVVIELDDSSHKSRVERDEFLDWALSFCGVGILHIRVQQAYNVNVLRKLIYDAGIESKKRFAK